MKISLIVLLFVLQTVSFSLPWFSTLLRPTINPVEFLMLSVDDAITHMHWEPHRDEIMQFVMILATPSAVISKAFGSLTSFDVSLATSALHVWSKSFHTLRMFFFGGCCYLLASYLLFVSTSVATLLSFLGWWVIAYFTHVNGCNFGIGFYLSLLVIILQFVLTTPKPQEHRNRRNSHSE